MAKQAGPFYFVGTIDDLVFYKLGDQYYVRRKSDLTAGTIKRLKNSKDNYPVMYMRQQEFGRASKLASEVYRTLKVPKRRHGLHGKLTSKALKLLRAGMAEELLLEQLRQHLAVLTAEPAVEASESVESRESVVTLLPTHEAGTWPAEVSRGTGVATKSIATSEATSLLSNLPTHDRLGLSVNGWAAEGPFNSSFHNEFCDKQGHLSAVPDGPDLGSGRILF